jgi:hypothetical protein
VSLGIAGMLLLLLQLLSDALPSFSADQLSQLMWAYAQFGHQPAPALMTAVLAQTEAQVAALQVRHALTAIQFDRSFEQIKADWGMDEMTSAVTPSTHG